LNKTTGILKKKKLTKKENLQFFISKVAHFTPVAHLSPFDGTYILHNMKSSKDIEDIRSILILIIRAIAKSIILLIE
jgi:hypothetical protein